MDIDLFQRVGKYTDFFLSLGVGGCPRLVELLHVNLLVFFHQFRKVGIVLLIHGYVFVLIMALNSVQLRQGVLVFFSKQPPNFISLVRVKAKQLKGILTERQGAAEGFPSNSGDAEIHKLK